MLSAVSMAVKHATVTTAAAAVTAVRREVYVLACYRPDDGELEGYLTDTGTFTSDRERAVEYHDQGIANGRCEFIEQAPGYRAYVWVVEAVPSKWLSRTESR